MKDELAKLALFLARTLAERRVRSAGGRKNGAALFILQRLARFNVSVETAMTHTAQAREMLERSPICEEWYADGERRVSYKVSDTTVRAILEALPTRSEDVAVTRAQIDVVRDWIANGFPVPNCAERVAIRACVAAMSGGVR